MSLQEPSADTHLRLKVTKCFRGVKRPVLQLRNTTRGHAGTWDGWQMPAPTTTDPVPGRGPDALVPAVGGCASPRAPAGFTR